MLKFSSRSCSFPCLFSDSFVLLFLSSFYKLNHAPWAYDSASQSGLQLFVLDLQMLVSGELSYYFMSVILAFNLIVSLGVLVVVVSCTTTPFEFLQFATPTNFQLVW